MTLPNEFECCATGEGVRYRRGTRGGAGGVGGGEMVRANGVGRVGSGGGVMRREMPVGGDIESDFMGDIEFAYCEWNERIRFYRGTRTRYADSICRPDRFSDGNASTLRMEKNLSGLKVVHLTSRRVSRRARVRLLQPDAPTAPKSCRLPLLPSGPGGVHRFLLRRIRLSMPRDPRRAIHPLLCKELYPAIADFGSCLAAFEAPLVPRLARLLSSL